MAFRKKSKAEKIGDKLRGRKRPSAVLAKAWATRRANKRKRSARKVTVWIRPAPEGKAGGPRPTTRRSKAPVAQGKLHRAIAITAAQDGKGTDNRATAMAATAAANLAPTRFDGYAERLLELAGSNNRANARPKVLEQVRFICSEERYNAEEAQRQFGRRMQNNIMLIELMANYKALQRPGGVNFAPYTVTASTMDAVVEALGRMGYSETGKTPMRTMGPDEAKS